MDEIDAEISTQQAAAASDASDLESGDDGDGEQQQAPPGGPSANNPFDFSPFVESHTNDFRMEDGHDDHGGPTIVESDLPSDLPLDPQQTLLFSLFCSLFPTSFFKNVVMKATKAKLLAAGLRPIKSVRMLYVVIGLVFLMSLSPGRERSKYWHDAPGQYGETVFSFEQFGIEYWRFEEIRRHLSLTMNGPPPDDIHDPLWELNDFFKACHR